MRIKIAEGMDSSRVAKIIIANDKNQVLFLKRASQERHPGEWDLPGGHVKKEEGVLEGLKREIKEETSIIIEKPVFYKKTENIFFFFAEYNQEKIILSKEHDEYVFRAASDIENPDKFEKIATELIKKRLENEK